MWGTRTCAPALAALGCLWGALAHAQDAPAAAPAADVDDGDDGFGFGSSDRVLNRYGFVGVRRVTSARVYGPVAATAQLSGGGFYLPDFVGPDVDQQVIVRARGAAALGFFDLVELSAQALGAGTENTIGDYSTRQAAPQFSVGAKLNPVGLVGLFTDFPIPVAAGLSAQVTMPARLNGIVPDYLNLSAQVAALVTVDLADAYGLPFRAHLNGGYRYQNAHYLAPVDTRARYYLQGVDGHVLAAAGDYWWYDQAFGGVAVEVPLPFVTPFVEAWWQGALMVPAGRGASGADYDFVFDPHTVVTPGVRVTPFQGVTFELFCDIGPTGNAGYVPPSLANVVDGQPLNPLYFAGGSVTVSMDAFSSSSPSSSAPAEAAGGDFPEGAATPDGAAPAVQKVEVCVTDGARLALPGARVSFSDGGLPDSLTGDDGCVRGWAETAATRRVTVSLEGFEDNAVTLEDGAPGRVVLERPIQRVTLQGSVRGEVDDVALPGTVELTRQDGSGFVEVDVEGGRFTTAVEPGTWVLQAHSDGYLRAGRVVEAVMGEPVQVAFRLNKVPARRIAKRVEGRIETAANVAFSSRSAELLSAAAFVLDDVVDVLLVERGIEQVKVVVLAKKKKGLPQAQERADVVKAYLEAHGVLPRRVVAEARVAKKGEKAGAVLFDIQPPSEPAAP